MPHEGSEGDRTSLVDRLLRQHATFAGLSAVEIARLRRDSTTVRLGPGEVLIRQGTPSDCAYLILSGEVDVSVESGYGAVPLARLERHALLGDLGVFAGQPRTATVTALSEVEALRIGRAALLEVGRENPAVAVAVLSRLGRRLDTINRAIGFYTHALEALEREEFNLAILDDLMNPVPELVNFGETFRRMAAQIQQRRAQREEMANAAAIQRSMLPPPLPAGAVAGWLDVFAKMRPARDVGGDFYDYFPLDEHRFAVVIADVCGKGVPASLFMAVTRTVIRLVAREGGDVGAGIGRANDLLCAENDLSMFATLFYAVIDAETGALTYCNAGHNPPLLMRAGRGIEELDASGPPLGIVAGIGYAPGAARLAPGDRILLYTDGVTEAADAAAAEFGMARLREAIAACSGAPAEGLVTEVFKRVEAFAGDAPQSDDITCLALVRTRGKA
jgi:phosphoserine phosphatase RsbU/P